MCDSTDLVHLFLPLAVRLGVIQRPLPLLLLVGVQVRGGDAAAAMLEGGGRGGGRVRGANTGAGSRHAALPFDGLLHAEIQGSVFIHLNVRFLEKEEVLLSYLVTEIRFYLKYQ